MTRLDPKQTRHLEQVEIGGAALTVLGSRQASGLLALTLADLEENVPAATIAGTVEQAVASNLTGETMLVEGLLQAVRTTLSATSADTHVGVGTTPIADSSDTSIEVEEEESVRADARSDGDELEPGAQRRPVRAEESTVFEEGTVEAALPRTAGTIRDALDYAGVPATLTDELTQSLRARHAMNDGEPLSDDQLELLDTFLAKRLSRPGGLYAKPSRERFAMIRSAIQTAAHHDELHDQLERARREAVASTARPSPEPVIDILAGVGLRRVEDV